MSNRKSRKRYTLADLIKHAGIRGGQLLSTTYTGSGDHYLWRCAEGHEWQATWASVNNLGTWCRRCSAANAASGKVPLLSPGEINQLYLAAGQSDNPLRDRALIEALMVWGCRPIELTILELHEFCGQSLSAPVSVFREHRFRHFNRRQTRYVNLPADPPGHLFRYIQHRVAESDRYQWVAQDCPFAVDPLFRNDEGGYFELQPGSYPDTAIRPTQMQNMISKIIRRAGFQGVTAATLRNHFIAEQMLAGVQLDELARLSFVRTSSAMADTVNIIKRAPHYPEYVGTRQAIG